MFPAAHPMTALKHFSNLEKGTAEPFRQLPDGVLALPEFKVYNTVAKGEYLKRPSYREIDYDGLFKLDDDELRSWFFLARFGGLDTPGYPCLLCGFIDHHWECGKTREIKCTRCRGKFSLFSGTILEGCRIPISALTKGLADFAETKAGVSALKLASLMKVSHPTAISLVRKVRLACAHTLMREPFEVTSVQADFQFFCRHKRPPNKGNGASFAAKRYDKPKVECALLSMVGVNLKRRLQCRVMWVPRESAEAVGEFFDRHVQRDKTVLVTDAAGAFTTEGATFLHHEAVNHSLEYQNEAGFNTNLVEGFHEKMRRLTSNTYRRMSVRTVAEIGWEGCWRLEMEGQSNRYRLFDLIRRLMTTPPDAVMPARWMGKGFEQPKLTKPVSDGAGAGEQEMQPEAASEQTPVRPMTAEERLHRGPGRPKADGERALKYFLAATRGSK